MGNNEQVSPSGRVSLTKNQLGTEEGIALLKLLEQLMEDGRLKDEEIRELASWLERTASASVVPGIHFLREEVAGILADGVVSDAERRLLRSAVLRVLPVVERERAKSKFAEASAQEKQARTAAANFATEKQKEYICDLGGACPDGATRQEASELIDRLLASRPTVRQRMVLRFWNRLDLVSTGVEGVSQWMDQWYAGDPDRLRAWELWKLESGDNGGRLRDSVDRVPIGVDVEFLARVKAGETRRAHHGPTGRSSSKETGPRGCLGQVIVVCGLLLVAATVLWLYL